MFRLRHPFRLGLLALALLVVLCAGFAFASANTVPKSGAGQITNTITPLSQLVPSICSGVNPVNFVGSSGTINGTAQRDYLVGGSGADTISGGNQADCILGGPGADTLNGDGGADVVHGGDGDDLINGGAGSDVLYGGAGNDTIYGGGGGDTIDGGPGYDICYGQAGTDTFVNCEAVTQ